MEEQEAIVELLEEVLGDHGLHYPNRGQISLLIFRSGSIIITGAKHSEDILNCYSFITNVISLNSKRLFYFDINEEIKQKKKKKKQ